jgi:hypothetical protein
MKLNNILLIAALLGGANVASASGEWDLQGVKYVCDTLQHYPLGPGTTVTVVDLTGPVKQRVFYTTTDLNAPNLEIKTYCCSPFNTYKTVPAMAEAVSGDIYFAGVNSDLFSYTGTGPIGSTVINGEIAKTMKSSTGWQAVGLDSDGALYYGQPSIGFGAKLNGRTEYAPTLVNVPRAENECILYTRSWGTTTKTTAGEAGVEIGLKPVNGYVSATGDTECQVVTAPVLNGGSMEIPEGGFVLSSNISSHLSTTKGLAAMKVGDTYTIRVSSVSLQGSGYGVSHSFDSVKQLSGGQPIILENGSILDTDGVLDHLKTRRPRTALGTDATGKRMVMLVVDGDSYNSGISAGCGSKDLAAMMLNTGCVNAINFDGGGSSTLYTQPMGVLNRPSDGNLRKVMSGWFVSTPDKGDTTVASIAFADWAKTLSAGESYTPVVYGYNAVGLLVDKNYTSYTLSCPSNLGTVAADGKTLTCAGVDGIFALTATMSNGVTATVPVTVGNPAGVVDINASADNTLPVEYFNLQGVRVDNPVNGIFIRRQGSHVTKVIR